MNPNGNPTPVTIFVSSTGLIHAGTATTTTASSVVLSTETLMPPFPHEGLHPVHEFHAGDPVSAIWVAFAGAAIYPTARAVFGGRKHCSTRDDD